MNARRECALFGVSVVHRSAAFFTAARASSSLCCRCSHAPYRSDGPGSAMPPSLSLALAPSLTAGVVCYCQPHERTTLAFAPATACSSSSYCWSSCSGLGYTEEKLKRSCAPGKSIGRDGARVVGYAGVCVDDVARRVDARPDRRALLSARFSVTSNLPCHNV